MLADGLLVAENKYKIFSGKEQTEAATLASIDLSVVLLCNEHSSGRPNCFGDSPQFIEEYWNTLDDVKIYVIQQFYNMSPFQKSTTTELFIPVATSAAITPHSG